MAMKKCRECGREVAKSAETCPNCGAALKRKKKPTSCLAMVVGIFLVVAVLAALGRRSDEPSDSEKQAGQPAATKPGVGAQSTQLTEVQGFTWGEDMAGVTQRLGLPAVTKPDGRLNIEPIVLNEMTFTRELVYADGKVVGLQLANEERVLFQDSIAPLRDALTKKYAKPVEERKLGAMGFWCFEKGGTSVRMQVEEAGAGWIDKTVIVYESRAHLAKVKKAQEAQRKETQRELEGDL